MHQCTGCAEWPRVDDLTNDTCCRQTRIGFDLERRQARSALKSRAVRTPVLEPLTRQRRGHDGTRAGTADRSGAASPSLEDRLAAIEYNTRESLELLRSLMTLLLAKETGYEGPRLEDLVATIIAQQRELLAVQRAMQRDITAMANRLFAADHESLSGTPSASRPY